jgi:hypothetical protein
VAVRTRAHHPHDRGIGDPVARKLHSPSKLTHRVRELVEVRDLGLVDVLKIRSGNVVLAAGRADRRLHRFEGSLEGFLAGDVVNILIDECAVDDVQLRPLDVDCLRGVGCRAHRAAGRARDGDECPCHQQQNRTAH